MSDEQEKNDDGWMDAGAEYSPKSEFSKPRIVEEAVTRCMTLRGKEMKSGYFNTTFTKEGLPLRQWIEDSRKAFCSSVQALKTLMMPEILIEQNDIDKTKTKKRITKIFSKVKRMDELLKEYSYYILEGKMVNNKLVFLKEGGYYMPDVDAIVNVRKIFPDGAESLVPIKGYWNNRIDTYWNNMVILNDELFEQLIMVVHRLNYFKSTINF